MANIQKAYGAIRNFDLGLNLDFLRAYEADRREALVVNGVKARFYVKNVFERMSLGNRKYVREQFNKFLVAFLTSMSPEEVEIWKNVKENVRGATLIGEWALLPMRDQKKNDYQALTLDEKLEYWYLMRLLDIFQPFYKNVAVKDYLRKNISLFKNLKENMKRYKKGFVRNEEKKFGICDESFFTPLGAVHLNEGKCQGQLVMTSILLYDYGE